MSFLTFYPMQIFGPQTDGGSELNFFPGVVGAVYQAMWMNKGERLEAIQHEVWRVARAIQRAACMLKGSFT